MGLFMAEKEGFEPSIPFWGIHDFQSCALGQLRDFSISLLRCQPAYNTTLVFICQPLFLFFSEKGCKCIWGVFPGMPVFGLFSNERSCGIILWHMQYQYCEVDSIEKIRKLYVMLAVILLLLVVPVSVRAADLNSQAGIVSVSSGWLNVRSSPAASATKISSLQKGSYVTLISKSGNWWKVEYAKGKFGYCHGDYIRVVSSDTAKVNVSSGSLNVRTGAGTGYQKIGSLYKGEAVVILSSSGDWSRILINGTGTGYVSSKYLSSYYAKISNTVPSLKQMDERWAEKTIGESEKTFSQIGCATTAIAMVESRRRGYTVYPDKMAEELRYTSTGSVYWPSDYVTVTQSDGYLERIYDLLIQGKVVLFGSRNSYWSQHWVVITGFSGGNTLTPSGFIIQDPGTYSRTNLQQFLDAYPNFYKYFYY